MYNAFIKSQIQKNNYNLTEKVRVSDENPAPPHLP
jgi:hypothetical protein